MAVAWLIFVLVCLAVFEDISGEWNNLTERVNISGHNDILDFKTIIYRVDQTDWKKAHLVHH
jgi:hypothetical protein